MGKSIDGIRNQDRSVGSRIASTPRPILSMSLQPAIPWRVALQQSPTPLHRLSTMLKGKQRLEKTITLNGNCVFRRLSHSRGSPHGSQLCSTAQWVNWTDLYPSAASANTNDTRPAERLRVKLERLNRRRRNGHDGSVIDRAKPAAINL
jgi:hypothetical protein